jgi:hypothetical protein
MPLTQEVTKRKYRVGQNPETIQTYLYNYTVPELSKDMVRELARDARMVNYSQRSKQEMIDFLNEQQDLPIRNIQLKVFRAGIPRPRPRRIVIDED